MKITETSLKRIIREELGRLDEAPEQTDWAKVLPKGIVKWDGGKKKRTAVETIQKALKALSEKGLASDPGTPDGKYGTNTANSITSFQRKKALKQDGDYGPNTRKAMVDALKVEVPEATPTPEPELKPSGKKELLTQPLGKGNQAITRIIRMLDGDAYGQLAATVGAAAEGNFGRAAQKYAKMAIAAYPQGMIGKLYTGNADQFTDSSASGASLARISRKTLMPTKSAYMNEFINATLLSIVTGEEVNVDLGVKAFFAVSEQEASAARSKRDKGLVNVKRYASNNGKFGPNHRKYAKRLKDAYDKVRKKYPLHPVLPENMPPSEKNISDLKADLAPRLKRVALVGKTINDPRFGTKNAPQSAQITLNMRHLLDKLRVLPIDSNSASQVLIPKTAFKAVMMADRKARGLKT